MHLTLVSIIALLSFAGASYGAAAGIEQQVMRDRPITFVEPIATVTSTRTIHVTLTTTTHMFRADATAPAPTRQQSHHHYAVPK